MEQEETKTTAAAGVEMPPEAESWVQLHESELTELMQKQAKAAITVTFHKRKSIVVFLFLPFLLFLSFQFRYSAFACFCISSVNSLSCSCTQLSASGGISTPAAAVVFVSSCSMFCTSLSVN
jgi:hypothetical protein